VPQRRTELNRAGHHWARVGETRGAERTASAQAPMRAGTRPSWPGSCSTSRSTSRSSSRRGSPPYRHRAGPPVRRRARPISRPTHPRIWRRVVLGLPPDLPLDLLLVAVTTEMSRRTSRWTSSSPRSKSPGVSVLRGVHRRGGHPMGPRRRAGPLPRWVGWSSPRAPWHSGSQRSAHPGPVVRRDRLAAKCLRRFAREWRAPAGAYPGAYGGGTGRHAVGPVGRHPIQTGASEHWTTRHLRVGADS
jgi:hypothetical protein